MIQPIRSSPLLGSDSRLDPHSQDVIQKTYAAEWAKAQELPTDDPLDPKRRRRVELTWNEIWAQPQTFSTTLKAEEKAIAEAARHFGALPLERIIMTGCGDSMASMIAVRTLYEQLLGIPCEPLPALDFTFYYHLPINETTLIISLSSSGATTRTVEAMLLARAMGAHTLALTNTPGSTLMTESDRGLLIHAERKGWPTQSSTAAMALLVRLVLELAKVRQGAMPLVEAIEGDFERIPAQMAVVLEAANPGIQAVAEIETRRSVYLYTGGGPAYASALFGAAKVKECSPDHGIAIPLEEYHHYNSQKAGDPLFLIAPAGPSVARALDTLHEGKRWGGQVYSLIAERDAAVFEASDRIFPMPLVRESLAAFIYTLPVQLFAYHVAMAKFRLAEQMEKGN